MTGPDYAVMLRAAFPNCRACYHANSTAVRMGWAQRGCDTHALPPVSPWVRRALAGDLPLNTGAPLVRWPADR